MKRIRRFRRHAGQAVLSLSLYGAGLFSGCTRQQDAPAERPAPLVSVALAAAGEVPVYIDAVGKIAARELVAVQPQVSGRITQLHFADGADVRAGQLLFSIDARPYQAQAAQAEGNLAQAEAALVLATANLARVESVSDSRAVSRQDYDTKKSAVAAAQAAVQQARAALDSARLNLEYCAIRAPIDGRAGQRKVDPGNIVTANGATLVVIQKIDPVYADFTITENELGTVRREMAKRRLSVEVRLPEAADEPRQGALTFLDNAVQEGSGSVKLRATIANRDRFFWPGRFAKVRLILATRADTVLIPAEAPQQSAKGAFVYVIDGEGKAELRPVALGQRQGEAVVVESGLKAGERVVFKGQVAVTPGGKVRMATPGSDAPPVQPGTKS